MTDEQLHRRMVSKRLLIISALLLILSGGLIYFRSTQLPQLATYHSQKSQEASLEDRVRSLQNEIATKTNQINEDGKQLVSFTEDKNVFINRASELAVKYQLEMNEISVSDVWQEGQMAGMTSRIEVQGPMENITSFIQDYCDTRYTNRITNVSCRPTEDYPWMYRYIDDLTVLPWLDLSAEEEKYASEEAELRRQQQQQALDNGESVVSTSQSERSITLDDMFKKMTFNLYIQVDFLGRQ